MRGKNITSKKLTTYCVCEYLNQDCTMVDVKERKELSQVFEYANQAFLFYMFQFGLYPLRQ